MAKYIAAEKVEVWVVPTITNLSAPTAAQMNAGTRLTTFIRGGVSIDFASNLVDSATLESAFNSTSPGTFGGGLNSLNGVLRDNANDAAWNALPRDTAGYLVIQLGTATGTAWGSGDVVDIYPWQVVSRNTGDLARDQLVTFDVGFAITSVPTFGSTVTA
jgi:hypothetical protein